jgi:hypothetical protein
MVFLACSSSIDCAREKAYKVVAFAAVGFSLLAVLAVCITMPIVYSFVSHVQQQTKHELNLCKVTDFICLLMRFLIKLIIKLKNTHSIHPKQPSSFGCTRDAVGLLLAFKSKAHRQKKHLNDETRFCVPVMNNTLSYLHYPTSVSFFQFFCVVYPKISRRTKNQ